MAYTFRHHL